MKKLFNLKSIRFKSFKEKLEDMIDNILLVSSVTTSGTAFILLLYLVYRLFIILLNQPI